MTVINFFPPCTIMEGKSCWWPYWETIIPFLKSRLAFFDSSSVAWQGEMVTVLRVACKRHSSFYPALGRKASIYVRYMTTLRPPHCENQVGGNWGAWPTVRTTPPDEPSQPVLSNESSLQGPRHGEIQISNLSCDLSEYMATKSMKIIKCLLL